MKNIFLTTLILFCFSLSSCYAIPSDTVTGDAPRLGVWITVFSPEKVLYSKENVDRLIETCKRTGIDDIYIQVYRADKAHYDSKITDSTPYKELLSKAGEDPLSYLIKKAGENGLEVHAWVNLLSLAQNRDATILKKHGHGVLTKDQHGRFSMPLKNKDELDKYYIRENQLFLEPGDWRVRKHLSEIVAEIAERYPGLSGVHFDYIRYPSVVPFIPGSRFTSHGISYGYNELNILNFEKSSGKDVKTMGFSRGNAKLWDDWRRAQVTKLVIYLSESIRKVSPSLRISATVVPSIERTYLTTFQDWTEWLNKGYVDHIVTMNYTDDTRLMELNTEATLQEGLKDKVQVGVGAYLLKDKPGILKKQLEYLRERSPSGVVIFSYDEIAASEDLQAYLAETF